MPFGDRRAVAPSPAMSWLGLSVASAGTENWTPSLAKSSKILLFLSFLPKMLSDFCFWGNSLPFRGSGLCQKPGKELSAGWGMGWVTEQSKLMPIAGKSTALGGSYPTQSNTPPQPKAIPTPPSWEWLLSPPRFVCNAAITPPPPRHTPCNRPLFYPSISAPLLILQLGKLRHQGGTAPLPPPAAPTPLTARRGDGPTVGTELWRLGQPTHVCTRMCTHTHAVLSTEQAGLRGLGWDAWGHAAPGGASCVPCTSSLCMQTCISVCACRCACLCMCAGVHAGVQVRVRVCAGVNACVHTCVSPRGAAGAEVAAGPPC